MIHKNKSHRKGFTLVEIIVAGLIISITALGSFGAYLYARQFSDKFRHRAHGMSGVQEMADYIRYRLADGYRNAAYLIDGTTYDVSTVDAADPDYDADLSSMLDPNNWQINNLVDNLGIAYTVNDVYFDNSGVEKTKVEFDALVAAADPSMPATRPAFKKITVKVSYDNRKTA